MRYFKYRHTGLLQVPNDIDKALNMNYLKCYFFMEMYMSPYRWESLKY